MNELPVKQCQRDLRNLMSCCFALLCCFYVLTCLALESISPFSNLQNLAKSLWDCTMNSGPNSINGNPGSCNACLRRRIEVTQHAFVMIQSLYVVSEKNILPPLAGTKLKNKIRFPCLCQFHFLLKSDYLSLIHLDTTFLIVPCTPTRVKWLGTSLFGHAPSLQDILG